MAAHEDIWDCGFSEPDECVLAVITSHGATPEAVAFYKEAGLFAASFQEIGRVDVVGTFEPRRANSNDDTVLVNGSPRTAMVDSIDVSSLATSPEYAELADAVNSIPTVVRC